MIPGDPLLKGQQLHSNPSLGKSVEDLFADIFWGISMPLEWLFWYTNMFLVITSDNSQGISALHCSFPHLTFLAWESTQNQLPRLRVKCRFTGIAEESGHPYVTASSSICFIRREKVTASFVCRTLLLSLGRKIIGLSLSLSGQAINDWPRLLLQGEQDATTYTDDRKHKEMGLEPFERLRVLAHLHMPISWLLYY